MKKLLALFTVAAMSLGAMAQEQEQGFYGNKFFDNWYAGVNGGVGATTTHQAIFENLNPNFGVKVGKLYTPVFGLGVEANAYIRNRTAGWNMSKGTAIRYHQLGLFATINLTNAIKGYYGEPRKWEVLFSPNFSWGHNYGSYQEGAKKNTLVNKLAFDVCYNFGKEMQWQAYIEPAFNYVIAGTRDNEIVNGVGNKLVIYNSNSSFMQLNAGINYKFKTSNGGHNFAVVSACDQIMLDELREQVNELRDKQKANAEKMVTLQKVHDDLENNLEACQTAEPPVKEVFKEPDLPAVFYQLNRSVITPAQQPNVAIAAEVLKNHPEYDILIKGYASPEGPHDNNTSLGIRRAGAVKTMLINKYKINPKRITAEGCGETDELFPVFEFNRVAVMFLQKREK